MARPRAVTARLAVLAVVAVTAAALAAPVAAGQALPADPPVLGAQVPRGTGEAVPVAPHPGAAERTVDGVLEDWVGEPAWFSGASVHSAGELVYTDHLFDAYGPDDGRDSERVAALGGIQAAVPETWRLEAVAQANLPGQFGFPTPPQARADTNYGNLPYQPHADLVELRLAADHDGLWVLARTAQMTPTSNTALLLLADTGRDTGAVGVPFNAGLTTHRADVAILLVGDQGWIADLGEGTVTSLAAGSVATNPEGFTNAIEARLPLDVPAAVAAATGTFDPAAQALAGTGLGANLVNVAFRPDEPSREWFDMRQALALHAGSIDEFFQPLEPGKLTGGYSERWVPGPGYHERVFASTTPGLAQEHGREGLYQHYGVYLPQAIIEGRALPTTFWLHWRGGTAHAAAALAPGIFRHQGEARDGIVISPRGRGSSTWYVGRGHADFLEVWDDALAAFPVDVDRVYLSGHSMGGWGSYLMAVLYPDRFAGALPVAGPVTQGAWTGLDAPGCDGLAWDEYTPCYISANDGRPRDQHTRRMLDNLRHVPLAMYYAAQDELVPISGATRQHERLVELGYPHRFYVFHGYEHYSHPVVDEWMEGVRYLDAQRRDPDPPRVTYVRDMPFERAVEEVQSGGIAFDFAFDAAYWMSELTPADPDGGRAQFDGRTHAVEERPTVTAPEAGGPSAVGQTGPYTMTGLREIPHVLAPDLVLSNAFTATLSGAQAVRLDLDRMRIDPRRAVTATVTTEHPLVLRLDARWRGNPTVTVDGRPAPTHRDGHLLEIALPAGTTEILVAPRGGPSPRARPHQ